MWLGSAGLESRGRVEARNGFNVQLCAAGKRWEMMEPVATSAAPLEVFLIEDSRGDVPLVREASKDAKVHLKSHVLSDGTEAMAFLGSETAHVHAFRSDLIWLDLNLSMKQGRKVLEEIKESSTPTSIPVVMLTSSASEAEVLRSYPLHANRYISDAVDLKGLLNPATTTDGF